MGRFDDLHDCPHHVVRNELEKTTGAPLIHLHVLVLHDHLRRCFRQDISCSIHSGFCKLYRGDLKHFFRFIDKIPREHYAFSICL
jgi:hypothetical protein